MTYHGVTAMVLSLPPGMIEGVRETGNSETSASQRLRKHH